MSEQHLWDKKIGRRDFFKLSAMGAVAAVTATALPSGLGTEPKKVSAAPRKFDIKPVAWSECRNLTPQQMVDRAAMTGPGYEYLMDKAKNVKDAKVRKIALEGLEGTRPKILELYPDEASKQRTLMKLLDAGYVKSDNTTSQLFPPDKGPDTVIQNYKVSPGSGWMSHHAYPGGLIAHVATDLQTALGVYDAYEQMYGYSLNYELLVSAILLHDNQKPWVLQWKDDNSCLPEINVAGTGDHHIMEIADAIHRGLDPDLVITIADSHEHPGWESSEKQVVGWIKAASIIAGVDPIKSGYLASNGETLPLPRRPEGFLVHLGDHDFVLTAPVCKWVAAELQKITKPVYKFSDADLKGKPFNTLRDYLYSQISDMHLYQIWVDQGEKALLDTVTKIVIPE